MKLKGIEYPAKGVFREQWIGGERSGYAASAGVHAEEGIYRDRTRIPRSHVQRGRHLAVQVEREAGHHARHPNPRHGGERGAQRRGVEESCCGAWR